MCIFSREGPAPTMVARPCCNQSLCYEGPSSDLVNTSHGRDIQRLLLSEECNIFGDDGMTHDVKKNHEENKKTARSKKVAINKYGLRVKEVHIYSMHKERKEQKMAERGGEKKKKKAPRPWPTLHMTKGSSPLEQRPAAAVQEASWTSDLRSTQSPQTGCGAGRLFPPTPRQGAATRRGERPSGHRT